LNSDAENDWNKCFYKDNIIISTDNSKFNVKFKSSNGWTDYEYDINPNRNIFILNKEKNILNKKLNSKFKEIRYNIDNKKQLTTLKKIVSNFPIRIQRKEKLKKLNSESE